MVDILKEIEQGLKQGVDAVKSTANKVIGKAEELTEKGKIQYQIYELKSKKQKQYESVGKKLHELIKTKKLKISNEDIKKLLSAIDKSNEELVKLQGKKPAAAAKKTAAAPAAAKPLKTKTAAKKSAPKKAPKSTAKAKTKPTPKPTTSERISE